MLKEGLIKYAISGARLKYPLKSEIQRLKQEKNL